MCLTQYILIALLSGALAEGKLLYGVGCDSTEFPCKNGQCIDKRSWCDAEIDCLDISDESYCLQKTDKKDPNRCSKDVALFLCNDGVCIPKVGRCDGYHSCADSSDEANCSKFKNSTIFLSKNITDLYEDVIASKVSRNKIEYSETRLYENFSNYFTELNYKNYKGELKLAQTWLRSQQSSDFGWGDYTSRAIIAMSLSSDGIQKDEQEILTEKQLDIELSMALNRNQSKPMALSELSLYINALMATCNNPRNFYGYDLAKTLRDRVNAAHVAKSFVGPFVYLTLCMNNLTEYGDVNSLQNLARSSHAEKIDILSLATLASSCIVKVPLYNHPQYHNSFVSLLLDKIRGRGLPVNIYELALVVQALTEAKIGENLWDRSKAMVFILEGQTETGSFGSILANYYVMPILAGKSLFSLANHCYKDFSNGLTPLAVLKNSDIQKIQVLYTLLFGNPVEMSQKIQIKVSKGTNILDIMRLAEDENPNFRYKLDDTKDVPFIYSIGGIPNDAERGLYWTLHLPDTHDKSKYIPYTTDLRRHAPKDGEEIVLWLKPV